MIKKSFHIEPAFISKAIYYANSYDTFCYLNPNDNSNGFEHTLAIGGKNELEVNNYSFQNLKEFSKSTKSTIFGMFSYDLKNENENLKSENTAYIKTPRLYFFEPEIIIEIIGESICISAVDPDNVFTLINAISHLNTKSSKINYKARTTREEYITNFNSIKSHLIEGDIYELNYCIDFYNDTLADFDPIHSYFELAKKNPSPFSSLFKNRGTYVISSSPERYLKRNNTKVISQPMKGTIKRSDNHEEDLALKKELLNSDKEKSENLMIVDLVRHDLSKHAVKGSVNVDELFGLYTFPKVHQLISTVSISVDEKTSSIDIIKNSFPMGSMTGAPKIKAMELIDKYENFQRGIFSGSIGYIKPNGDFDLNVLIRTLVYDKTNAHLSFSAGSAITYDSNAESEYEECLLKATTLITSLY